MDEKCKLAVASLHKALGPVPISVPKHSASLVPFESVCVNKWGQPAMDKCNMTDSHLLSTTETRDRYCPLI